MSYHPFPTGFSSLTQPKKGGKTLTVYAMVRNNGVWTKGPLLTTFSMIEWLGDFQCLNYAKSLFTEPIICAIVNIE